MKDKTTGSESLILVLTPYEVGIVQMALSNSNPWVTVGSKEHRAMERIRLKTEKALAERYQAHSRSKLNP